MYRPTINFIKTADNIKNLRIKHGYSVKDIAEYFRFNNLTTVYKWESGICLPNIENLMALCVLYNVYAEDILVYN